jgi:hypothetical protein
MKAIVHATYGSADVLELRDIELAGRFEIIDGALDIADRRWSDR